jgi:hypothetical protein
MDRMRHHLLSLSVVLACAGPVGLAGAQQAVPSPEPPAPDAALAAAVARAQVVPLPTDKKRKVYKLDEKDPVATFAVDGESFMSSYDVFRFEAVSGMALRIEMSLFLSRGSVGEVLRTGATVSSRTILFPIVHVLGPDSLEVPFSVQELRPVQRVANDGVMTGVWEFTPSHTGAHSLIVATDTRQVGKPWGGSSVRIAGGLASGWQFRVNAVVAPKGDYGLRLASVR